LPDYDLKVFPGGYLFSHFPYSHYAIKGCYFQLFK